jgi:hypothetical protein
MHAWAFFFRSSPDMLVDISRGLVVKCMTLPVYY